MDNFYRKNILDHYKNPLNFGRLDKADVKSKRENISCGDSIVMQIKFKKQKKGNKIIEKIMFYGEGCAISVASASMLTEKAKGKSIEDLKNLKKDDIINLLNIPISPVRLRCALLPLEALHKTLALVKDE